MPTMTDRSLRVLDTLVQADPEFVALCDVLYGPGIDASVVHADVFEKRGPQLGEQERRERLQARIGLASNYVGIAAGTAGLAAAAQDERLANSKAGRVILRGGKKVGKLVPGSVKTTLTRHPGKVAGGALALQGANLVGDAVANRVLGRSAKKPVVKAMPKVDELAAGAYAAANKVLPGMFKPTGKHAAPAPDAGIKVGELLHKPIEHKKATAITVGAALAGNKKGKAKGRREGFQQGYYAKRDEREEIPDLELAGTFSKFDDAKRQAFGYASVVSKNGMPVIDRQGDYIDADEMEKAAYAYVQKSRKGGDMHRRTVGPNGEDAPHHVSDLIESMVFTPEKCQAMGLPDEVAKKLEGHWWVGYQIHDEDTWEAVRKQGRTGFSIHGRGKRQETTIDKIIGY